MLAIVNHLIYSLIVLATTLSRLGVSYTVYVKALCLRQIALPRHMYLMLQSCTSEFWRRCSRQCAITRYFLVSSERL